MLKLVRPKKAYWDSFLQGLEEFKSVPMPYNENIARAAFFTNFKDYKQDCENNRLGRKLKENYVPATCLWLIEDKKFVGIYDIRHRLTDSLKVTGGHIGYAVVPSARGRGLAKQGLKLCCRYAHDVLHIQDVLLTCDADNIASYKTMKSVMTDFGGLESPAVTVENKEKKRVWIKTAPRPVQIRPLAVAVIKKGNRVLAFKGYDDKKRETFYRLIGGGIEFAEKGQETIKREFMEEFGFEPENIRYKTTVENIFTFNGRQGHEIVLVYEADLPPALKGRNIFYGIEENIQDRYAEFVPVGSQHKIYPEGIF